MSRRDPRRGTRTGHRFAGPLVLALIAGAPHLARAQDTDACINASEKAVALRKADQLIEERASLAACAASSCPDAVRTSCEQRLGQVTQAIPSIVFFAKDGSGRDLASVKLTIDGSVYADHLDGSAITLNPGEHEFRFEVPGQAPVEQRFVLHQGDQNRREDIVIGVAPALPTESAAKPPETKTFSMDQGSTSHGSAQRTAGLVVGGVGLASLVAGAIFGGLSLAAHASYEKDCGSNLGPQVPAGQCTAQGVSGQSDAATKGTLSTVFFVAGGVLTAAGGVIFFTAPKGGLSAQVGWGFGGVVAKGQF